MRSGQMLAGCRPADCRQHLLHPGGHNLRRRAIARRIKGIAALARLQIQLQRGYAIGARTAHKAACGINRT